VLEGDHWSLTGMRRKALVELVDVTGDARRVEGRAEVQGEAGAVARGVESALLELGCRQPEGVEGAASLL